MNLVKLSLVFCFASLLSSPLFADDTDCQDVAKQAGYVKPKIDGIDKYLNLQIGHFQIKIPPGYIRMFLNVAGDLSFEYPDKSTLAVSTSFLRKGKWYELYEKIDITQYPKISYLKTTCDKEPENETARKLWKHALSRKKDIFKFPQDTRVTEAGRLTYYLTSYYANGRVSAASVVDAKYDYTYLELDGHNMPHEEFKKIVLNITVVR